MRPLTRPWCPLFFTCGALGSVSRRTRDGLFFMFSALNFMSSRRPRDGLFHGRARFDLLPIMVRPRIFLSARLFFAWLGRNCSRGERAFAWRCDDRRVWRLGRAQAKILLLQFG